MNVHHHLQRLFEGAVKARWLAQINNARKHGVNSFG